MRPFAWDSAGLPRCRQQLPQATCSQWPSADLPQSFRDVDPCFREGIISNLCISWLCGENGTHRRFGGSLVPPCSWAIPQWNSTDFELRELISLTGESLPEGKCPDTPCSHNLHEKTCLKRAVGFSRILNSARSIGPCSPTFSCVYSPSFST